MTKLSLLADELPAIRGKYKQNAPLGTLSRFGCGGRADIIFRPADEDDLACFLRELPEEIPVTIMGLMSNTIIRDGGVRGVVIRLGSEFNYVRPVRKEYIDGECKYIETGASTLDMSVATYTAEAGISGMEFLAGIPGSIGGAVRMNAGAYGGETKDILVEIRAVTRKGEKIILSPDELDMSYRHSNFPPDTIVTSCILRGIPGDKDKINASLEKIRSERDYSQPVREKTGGSTFANPAGHKSWKLIDAAGMRGFSIGGARMSEKHCNFMINDGTATASELEELGETVRDKVLKNSGIELRWEIKRIGEPAE